MYGQNKVKGGLSGQSFPDKLRIADKIQEIKEEIAASSNIREPN
jgi:hypothetical protein